MLTYCSSHMCPAWLDKITPPHWLGLTSIQIILCPLGLLVLLLRGLLPMSSSTVLQWQGSPWSSPSRQVITLLFASKRKWKQLRSLPESCHQICPQPASIHTHRCHLLSCSNKLPALLPKPNPSSCSPAQTKDTVLATIFFCLKTNHQSTLPQELLP